MCIPQTPCTGFAPASLLQPTIFKTAPSLPVHTAGVWLSFIFSQDPFNHTESKLAEHCDLLLCVTQTSFSHFYVVAFFRRCINSPDAEYRTRTYTAAIARGFSYYSIVIYFYSYLRPKSLRYCSLDHFFTILLLRNLGISCMASTPFIRIIKILNLVSHHHYIISNIKASVY